MMHPVLDNPWGRLFRDWENVKPDAAVLGCPQIGTSPAEFQRVGFKAFTKSLGILGTCVTQNPDVGTKRRRIGVEG